MAKANTRRLRQDTRMVLHDDEHAVLKEILGNALGDDDCFRRLVSSDPAESARVEDRLVLARFFDRMERQFALRVESRAGRTSKAGSLNGGSR